MTKKTYKIYGGTYNNWKPLNDSDIVVIPNGEAVEYKLCETVIGTEKKAINCAKSYYNNNIKVLDVEANVIIYERKNGIVIT